MKTLESADKHQLPDHEDDSSEEDDYDDDEEDDGSDEYMYDDEEEDVEDEEDDGIDDEDEDSSVEDSSVEDSSVEDSSEEDSSEESVTKKDDGMSCSDEEYRKLKNNLLLYHCARIGDSDCTEEFKRKSSLTPLCVRCTGKVNWLTKGQLVDSCVKRTFCLILNLKFRFNRPAGRVKSYQRLKLCILVMDRSRCLV